VHVRLDRRQQFGFEQELGQAEPFHGVTLHDLHDRSGEVGPDIPEPAVQLGRTGAETRATLAVAIPAAAVKRGQGVVAARIVLTKAGQPLGLGP
jgi:hypothetical protein